MAGYGALPSAAPLVLEAQGGPWAVRGAGALPSAAGISQGAARAALAGLGSLSSAAGVVRGRGRSFADDWAMAGFPLPRMEGYAYAREAGVVRVDMYSGRSRQRRRWIDGRRQADVTFVIPFAKLYALEQFLDLMGYDWFGMGLVTGDNTVATVEAHTVRVMDDPAFGEISGHDIIVTLAIELAA